MEVRLPAVLEILHTLKFYEVIVEIIHLDPIEQSCSKLYSSLVAHRSHHREALMITAQICN